MKDHYTQSDTVGIHRQQNNEWNIIILGLHFLLVFTINRRGIPFRREL